MQHHLKQIARHSDHHVVASAGAGAGAGALDNRLAGPVLLGVEVNDIVIAFESDNVMIPGKCCSLTQTC